MLQPPPDVFRRRGGGEDYDDEVEVRWAALERLPTYDRLMKAVLTKEQENGRVKADEVDLTKLNMDRKKQLMDSILKAVEEDNEMFLTRLRDRIDR